LPEAEMRKFRALFISDVHLGSRGCQALLLLDFLRYHDADVIYLVGDIVDGWQLRSSWYWPQPHNDVIQKLLRKSRKGTRVLYIPGNHDEAARQFVGQSFGEVDVADDHVHETADGRRFLVIHGDQFDVVVRYAKWLAHVGDKAYELLLHLNTVINTVRRRLGFSYWSLSAYMKQRAKRAVEFVGRFELALVEEAKRRGVDGVICGHIHTAELKDMQGMTYVNDGDWVESCTALVEHLDGRLEILHWPAVMAAREASAAQPSLKPQRAA
jgi:UDP-2,3-diacylglucosamine pyrophosphatase LpxH